MAFLPSITWGRQQQQPAQAQQANQQQPNSQQVQHPQNVQQNPGMQQPGAMNSNGSGGPARSQQQAPANSQMQPGGNPANPLDPFLQLMTPPKEVQDQYQQQQQQQSQGLFGEGFTSEAVNQLVGQQNFAGNIDPQEVQKALGGDTQAFMGVLNQVAASAASTAIQASKGMVEHGVKTGTERFGSSLDSRIRNFQLQNQNSQNPALQHPVGKALLSSVKKQIATANPKLSPEEVHQQSETLFMQFANMLVQKPGEENDSQSNSEPNWEAFLQN